MNTQCQFPTSVRLLLNQASSLTIVSDNAASPTESQTQRRRTRNQLSVPQTHSTNCADYTQTQHLVNASGTGRPLAPSTLATDRWGNYSLRIPFEGNGHDSTTTRRSRMNHASECTTATVVPPEYESCRWSTGAVEWNRMSFHTISIDPPKRPERKI